MVTVRPREMFPDDGFPMYVLPGRVLAEALDELP